MSKVSVTYEVKIKKTGRTARNDMYCVTINNINNFEAGSKEDRGFR